MPARIRGGVPLFICALKPGERTKWCGSLNVSCSAGECRVTAETERGTGFAGRPRGSAVVRFEAPYVSFAGAVYRVVEQHATWSPCMTSGGCRFEYTLPAERRMGRAVFRLSTRWDPARPHPYRLVYWHEPAWPGGWVPYPMVLARRPQGRPRAVVLGLEEWPVKVYRFRGYRDLCSYTVVLPDRWRVARYWWELPLCLDTGGGCRWTTAGQRRLRGDRGGRTAHWWGSCGLAGVGLAPRESRTITARLVGVPARYAGEDGG